MRRIFVPLGRVDDSSRALSGSTIELGPTMLRELAKKIDMRTTLRRFDRYCAGDNMKDGLSDN